MVRLTKIYTKTGDDGTTGLAGGRRVRKDDPRVECYGTVDEANACLGQAEALCTAGQDRGIGEVLRSLQHDLFDLGADLATPILGAEKPGQSLRMVPDQTTRLEQVLDRFNDQLSPLTSFVLPGGTRLAASLHVARTVVRRAERLAVQLRAENPQETGSEPVRYLNRLSDLLFVLARVANDNGATDVLWVPGANRAR